jgi:hypothetical protein
MSIIFRKRTVIKTLGEGEKETGMLEAPDRALDAAAKRVDRNVLITRPTFKGRAS